MRTLLIDTSSEYSLLALIEGSSILSHTYHLHENRLSQCLLPDIIDLLARASITIKDIQRIAVGVGPGSYTGTRVGVAIAKSLAFGLNIPLRGFCSLLAFLPELENTFASIMPAKSGCYFVALGTQTAHTIDVQHTALYTQQELSQALLLPNYLCIKNNNDLPTDKPIYPFQFNPNNLWRLLNTDPVHAFEINAELIYLHAPT